MRRRTLLAGIGALSAGCLGASPPRANDATPSTDDTETPSRMTAATTTCDRETETSSADAPTETPADAEYRLTDLTESASVDRPSVRYVLEPSAFFSGDAVERKEERTGEAQVVADISEIGDEDVRDAIETAIRTGEWRSNALPDGLVETVERVDFFTGVSEGETYTHVGVTLHRLRPDRPPAVAFSATVVDGVVSAESPGEIELALTNRSSTTQSVFSGTVPPFGMVFAESDDGSDEFLLWRNYEREGCIRFSDGNWIRCDIGKITELEPCETIARRYEVLPSTTDRHPEYTVPPGPGTYRIADSLSYYEERGAPESKLSFEVELGLESA